MKRRTAHIAFAVSNLIILGVLGWQALQLQRGKQLHTALDSIPQSLDSQESISNLPQQQANQLQAHPLVQLSMGSALAHGNNLEESERTLNDLIGKSDNSEIVANAQYNLANAYLRQALVDGTQTSSQTLPMVELAKQRYRDLLAQSPDHWNARYNLERALQIAPELVDKESDERNEKVKSVNVVVPGFEKKDLP